MAKSRARQVTGTLAEATGRSDDELRLALTVAAALAAVFAGIRFINFLENLGIHRSRARA